MGVSGSNSDLVPEGPNEGSQAIYCLVMLDNAARPEAVVGLCPGGTDDRSQAIYCLECVKKSDPSRRDGVIGSDRRATIRTINQTGVGDQTVPNGTDSQLACSRQ